MDSGMWVYVMAIALLTMTPGVDTMLVIRNTSRGGVRDGIASSVGICSGLFLHATISAVGISMLLLKCAWAFRALKLVGALYLIWLGLVSFNAALKAGKLDKIGNETAGTFSLKHSLWEGFLCNSLNPKAALFYMAFLPQFIDPEHSALAQSLFLAGLHFAIAMVWLTLVAILVDKAKVILSTVRVRRIFDVVTGSIMVFFGITLGLEE
ncbi:MAG: LysE family translocator [Desulfobacterium sp.]|nr:LysE family translocator [Desulfobacterium sp.]